MSEKEQNTTPTGNVERGALTGSGGVDFIIQVSENPTVATAVVGTVATAVRAKVLGGSRPKDPPQSKPPSADK